MTTEHEGRSAEGNTAIVGHPPDAMPAHADVSPDSDAGIRSRHDMCLTDCNDDCGCDGHGDKGGEGEGDDSSVASNNDSTSSGSGMVAVASTASDCSSGGCSSEEAVSGGGSVDQDQDPQSTRGASGGTQPAVAGPRQQKWNGLDQLLQLDAQGSTGFTRKKTMDVLILPNEDVVKSGHQGRVAKLSSALQSSSAPPSPVNSTKAHVLNSPQKGAAPQSPSSPNQAKKASIAQRFSTLLRSTKTPQVKKESPLQTQSTNPSTPSTSSSAPKKSETEPLPTGTAQLEKQEAHQTQDSSDPSSSPEKMTNEVSVKQTNRDLQTALQGSTSPQVANGESHANDTTELESSKTEETDPISKSNENLNSSTSSVTSLHTVTSTSATQAPSASTSMNPQVSSPFDWSACLAGLLEQISVSTATSLADLGEPASSPTISTANEKSYAVSVDANQKAVAQVEDKSISLQAPSTSENDRATSVSSDPSNSFATFSHAVNQKSFFSWNRFIGDCGTKVTAANSTSQDTTYNSTPYAPSPKTKWPTCAPTKKNSTFSSNKTKSTCRQRSNTLACASISRHLKDKCNLAFPLVVYLPDGTAVATPMKRYTTPAQICSRIALLCPQLESRSLRLTSHTGALLDHGFILCECEDVLQCTRFGVWPRVHIVSFIARGRQLVASHLKHSVTEKPKIVLNSTFLPFQLLIPGGQTLYLKCSTSDTLTQIKQLIIPQALQEVGLILPPNAYNTFVPGLKNTLSIMNVPFIALCRSYGIIPKLVLERQSIDRQVAIENDISTILGEYEHSIGLEELIFKQKAARLRYQQRISGIPLWLSSAPPEKQKGAIDINIELPLLGTTMHIPSTRSETADGLITKLFSAFYAQVAKDCSANDFVLKVKFLDEYIFGSQPLVAFHYINATLESNQVPFLVITTRPDPSQSPDFEHFPDAPFFKLPSSTLEYSHDYLDISKKPWQEIPCFSIWSYKDFFSFKVIGLEFPLTSELPADLVSIFIAAGLYHGGELLSPLIFTDVVPVSNCTHWKKQLRTLTPMCELPRATRLCFTAFGRVSKEDTQEVLPKDNPLGWVSCLLFDYKHELITGKHILAMWLNDKANPIGTCNENFSEHDKTLSICIEFPKYTLPIVFPTQDASIETSTKMDGSDPIDVKRVDEILEKDQLYPLTEKDKKILWSQAERIKDRPKALPRILSGVNYRDRFAVSYLHRLLSSVELKPFHALELLDAKYPDSRVRELAVETIDKMSDQEILDYLIQLVQVLKYEPYQDSSLAMFLLKRGLTNPKVGQDIFWHLLSEVHVPDTRSRYHLLLDAYLRGCGPQRKELLFQHKLLNGLRSVANGLKVLKDSDRQNFLLQELKKYHVTSPFHLPVNPDFIACGLEIPKCKYMDSKKLPLWLVFQHCNSERTTYPVLFKSGDDLRQDMLTLQMIRLMDNLWKAEGLDLQLSPYRTMNMGDSVGMIEIVQNATTTANIHKQSGGATAAFRNEPLATWIRKHNTTDEDYKCAVTRFMLSCAGYCVATYVLGIGDRHNDNIMLTKTGCLFHIDFGHFLGHKKKKLGINREPAPFVFTPDFAYVMGGRNSPDFERFTSIACTAYNIIRRHAYMFITLLALMLSTGIPELQSENDIKYLRDAFSLDMTDKEAADKFKGLIILSLTTWTTRINNAVHIAMH
ncbi:phosphatidylinositol-4,5-diphosphate 3-kinase [Pelomyxa schiedti]|nr:phosphatidylinositol-4,5-diphosphate 3-kinase [Pelomyxa schiedti]